MGRGTREKVKTTGQTKSDLMKNRNGNIVSKKAHKAGMRAYKRNGLSKWTKAFMQARKNLKIKGFMACKGNQILQRSPKTIQLHVNVTERPNALCVRHIVNELILNYSLLSSRTMCVLNPK